MEKYITPNWPAPKNIKAFSTTRLGGLSLAPFDSFNLGLHVNDDATLVYQNRALLEQELALPESPRWLNQVHQPLVVQANDVASNNTADAIISHAANQVCAVMTADCLPIIICSKDGEEIAAIHASWRCLLMQIIKNTTEQMRTPPEQLIAWLGPAIGPDHLELNPAIYQDFVNVEPAQHAGFRHHGDKIFADIYQLAKIQLQLLGLHEVYGGDYCTFSQPRYFFSHRRDQGKTGRMATLIWRET